MRRIVTAALSVSLALSVMLMAGGTASASERGSPNAANYQASAIVSNDGTQTFAPGVVGLLICLPDKVTCNVASQMSSFTRWFSSTVYATVSATVSHVWNGSFIYNSTSSATALSPGTAATFNGDVGIARSVKHTATSLVGTSPPILLTTSGMVNAGYYQINTTPATTYFTSTMTSSYSTLTPATLAGKLESARIETSAAISDTNGVTTNAAAATYTDTGVFSLGTIRIE